MGVAIASLSKSNIRLSLLGNYKDVAGTYFMLTRLITKIAVFVVPIILDALCIGLKRWARSRSYRKDHHLYDDNNRY